MNIKAPFIVHNFKTKPPFDKWSIPYDGGVQNTAFVDKMTRALPCRSFSEKPRRKLSQNQKEVQQFLNCKRSWTNRLLLNFRNFKTKPPDDEWSTPYDRALQNTAFLEKLWELRRVSGLFRKVSPFSY